jgi:hypothetical protein
MTDQTQAKAEADVTDLTQEEVAGKEVEAAIAKALAELKKPSAKGKADSGVSTCDVPPYLDLATPAMVRLLEMSASKVAVAVDDLDAYKPEVQKVIVASLKGLLGFSYKTKVVRGALLEKGGNVQDAFCHLARDLVANEANKNPVVVDLTGASVEVMLLCSLPAPTPGIACMVVFCY